MFSRIKIRVHSGCVKALVLGTKTYSSDNLLVEESKYLNTVWMDFKRRCTGYFSGELISDAHDPVYMDAYNRSISNPEDFWGELGRLIDWHKPWERVMDNSNPPFTKWYCGGYVNACYNAVDRHVLNGNGNKVALIYDSPLTNTIRHVTYQELYDEVLYTVPPIFIIMFFKLFLLFLGLNFCWWSRKFGAEEGRSCRYLHATDTRSDCRYVGHGATRRCALCGFWWLRGQRTLYAY